MHIEPMIQFVNKLPFDHGMVVVIILQIMKTVGAILKVVQYLLSLRIYKHAVVALFGRYQHDVRIC